MANDVVPSGGNAVAAYDGNPWAEAARGVETGTYLKFNGNDGRWSFGQDDEDLPEGSRVVTDMQSMAFGFICWVDGSVEEEVLVPVVEGKAPKEHELTDYGPYDDDDGWRDAASLSMVLESYGEDDQDEAVGTQFLWKTSTGGQVRQIRKLSGAYGRVFGQHPGEFPIVELGAEGYTPKNKKHGKRKFSPLLKIVGWMTEAELEGLVGDLGDDEDEPKKLAASKKEEKPARRRKAEPEEDEEEEEKPAPRRRRKAEPEPEPEVEDEGDEEEEEKPAPRRRRKAEPEEDEEEEEKPAPRRRRKAEPEPEEDEDEGDEDEGDEAPAPKPRGRSAGRRGGGNARVRSYD